MQNFQDDLKDLVIAYIRKEIFEDRSLLPGEQINERELSRTLNISRAPVREAFKELEEQGFITSIKYKGWFVADLSNKETMEINNIRTLLEHSLFETAIKESSFGVEDLRPAELVNLELCEIAEEDDCLDKVYRFLEKEMEFHMHLHALAKDHCLWTRRILKNLSYQIRLSFIGWLYKYGYMRHSFETHSQILRCLKEYDIQGLKILLSQRLTRYQDLEKL